MNDATRDWPLVDGWSVRGERSSNHACVRDAMSFDQSVVLTAF
jgi:hypothetical protein